MTTTATVPAIEPQIPQDSAMSAFARRVLKASTTSSERTLHALLIDAGKIKAEHIEPIRRAQREHNLRFEEAVVRLGFVSPADMERALSQRFTHPGLPQQGASLAPELVAAIQTSNARVEAFRALRSQLMLRWFEISPRHKVLAVVSPERGDGRSFVAANLAVTFSQLGERTLLIDADMRHPRQHAIFRLENAGGLSAILAGRGDLDTIHHMPSLVALSVLPSGLSPDNPQELLARPLFRHMLSELAIEFDVIVVDTPAGEAYADVQTISARAGGALMVMHAHSTRLKSARNLVQNITGTGATIVGSVMNTF
jgi:protein-tyrosine kinase